MDRKEINQQMRIRQARVRAKNLNPVCHVCGDDDPVVIEAHHLAQRKFDATTVPLCASCHKRATHLQKDHPPFHKGPKSQQEIYARMLAGIADLLLLIVEKIMHVSEWLFEQAKMPNAKPLPT